MNSQTHDIDRLIAEIVKVRRTVQVFSELFVVKSSSEVLSSIAPEVFFVIWLSMHDDVVMSLARLGDVANSKVRGSEVENLSIANIVKTYDLIKTARVEELKDKTKRFYDSLFIDDYRNKKIGHNDKLTMLSDPKLIKHKLSSEGIIRYLDSAYYLLVAIKAEVKQTQNVDVGQTLEDSLVKKTKALIKN